MAADKETFYFSHDYNARMDDKIKPLIRKFGMAGYGIFWAIVEDLYNNANALRTDYDGIAYALRTKSEIVKSIINDFNLFVISEDTFSSESIKRRLSRRNEKSEKARESAKKRWLKPAENAEKNANALRTLSDRNAIKERKGKERIEKDNKGNESKLFVPPTLDEFVQYFLDNKFSKELGERAWRGYHESGWIDSQKNKIHNWKLKCQHVWFKNNDYQTKTPLVYKNSEQDYSNSKQESFFN